MTVLGAAAWHHFIPVSSSNGDATDPDASATFFVAAIALVVTVYAVGNVIRVFKDGLALRCGALKECVFEASTEAPTVLDRVTLRHRENINIWLVGVDDVFQISGSAFLATKDNGHFQIVAQAGVDVQRPLWRFQLEQHRTFPHMHAVALAPPQTGEYVLGFTAARHTGYHRVKAIWHRGLGIGRSPTGGG